MQRPYWRCNGGHYFSSPACPLDGWSRPYFQRLFEVVEEMKRTGQSVSIERLREEGFGEDELGGVIVVEFGSDAPVFDGIVPDGYLIGEKFIHWRSSTGNTREVDGLHESHAQVPQGLKPSAIGDPDRSAGSAAPPKNQTIHAAG
jgi:hypothetical protein